MSPLKSPEKLGATVAGKQDKIVVEIGEAEELPPGWRKEVKRRKTVSGSATKVDRFYTDPVTGYVFRSLKDAQRYIKTGELGRLAIKPKMVEREKPSELKEPMSESLKQKGEQTDKSELPARASNRPPPSPSLTKTRQATQLAEVAVDAPSDTRTNHQGTRLSGSKIDASISSPAAPKTRQAARQAGIKIDSPPPLPPDSKTRQATGVEIGLSPPSQPEPKTRQAKRASGTPQQPKTRQATRQAGIKINSPPDTRTSRHTGSRPVISSTPKENDKKTEAENITDKHDQIADLNANPNHNQENSIAIAPLNQESNEKQELIKKHNKAIEMGPVTLPPHEDQPPPTTVIPPVSLEKHKLPVVNPSVNNPIPLNSYGCGNDMKPDSSINFSLNDLWTDPCIEFAVKTLTGAIPVTDLNKVENFTAPSQVPAQDIWTDPCIEFAVKTLTGAIPVGEDDHLLDRPASSSNPQGPCQFSYETGHKNKQQDLVFPTLGNGGFQKSGKFVNGSNGQSSRSRFFQ